VRHQANYKPVAWVGSSKKDLKHFPEAVQGSIGDALQEAQYGRKSASAKPLSGFHGAGVLEIIDNDDGDTTVLSTQFAFRKSSMFFMRSKRNHGKAFKHQSGILT
jgi:phage-related protein